MKTVKNENEAWKKFLLCLFFLCYNLLAKKM